MLRRMLCVLCIALSLTLASCVLEVQKEEVVTLIGVSQANTLEPWRNMLRQDLEEEAAKYPGVRLVFTDAADDPGKQIQDLDRLMAYGVDLLIIAPCDGVSLSERITELTEQFPVIAVSRDVGHYESDLFIGPDNEMLGRMAADAVIRVGGTRASVLEIGGGQSTTSYNLRSQSFQDVMTEYPGVTLRYVAMPSELRDVVEDYFMDHPDLLQGVDVIYAHNDAMALGARRALDALGYPDVAVIGTNGFPGSGGGLELVRSGDLQETITCPTGGREAIRYALDFLDGQEGMPQRVALRSHSVNRDNLDAYERSLARTIRLPDRTIVVGYAPAENDTAWQRICDESIKEAVKGYNIELVEVDAEGSPQRQKEIVQEFIEGQMDVIILFPIEETGWYDLLEDAVEAGISVLLVGRPVQGEAALFATYIGVDYYNQGHMAMYWIEENIPKEFDHLHLVELMGNESHAGTGARSQGFRDILNFYSDEYELVFAASGDGSRESGQEMMEQYLKEHIWEADVIFAHNDDIALGAIEALERAGYWPGGDVYIVTINCSQAALSALQNGTVSCVVQSPPQLGPIVMKAVTEAMSGIDLPYHILVNGSVITAENAAQVLEEQYS